MAEPTAELPVDGGPPPAAGYADGEVSDAVAAALASGSSGPSQSEALPPPTGYVEGETGAESAEPEGPAPGVQGGPEQRAQRYQRSNVYPIEIRLAVGSRCTHRPKDPSPLPELLAVITVVETATIWDLKRVLEDASKTPRRYQKLAVGLRTLENTFTLAQEGIVVGTKVLLHSLPVDPGEFFRDIPPAEFNQMFFVRYLLYNKANPLSKDATGATVLHSLSSRGINKIARFFLRDPRFTGVNGRNKQGATALHLAAACRQTETCKMLIKEERFTALDAADDHGATALHRAAEHGLIEVCELLLATATFTVVNDRTASGATVLHQAAAKSHGDICHLFLGHDRFKDINAKDKSGSTALHRAAGTGLTDVCWSLVQDGRFLVADARNWEGLTAEQIAEVRGHTEISSMLAKTRAMLFNDRLSDRSLMDALRSAVHNSGPSRCFEFAEIAEEDPNDTAKNAKRLLAQCGPLAESCMVLLPGYDLHLGSG